MYVKEGTFFPPNFMVYIVEEDNFWIDVDGKGKV